MDVKFNMKGMVYGICLIIFIFICGRRQRNGGRAGATGGVNGVGGGCGNGEGRDHADRKDKGENLLGVFHGLYSFL